MTHPTFFVHNPRLPRGTELRCDASLASNKKNIGMKKIKNNKNDMTLVAIIRLVKSCLISLLDVKLIVLYRIKSEKSLHINKQVIYE